MLRLAALAALAVLLLAPPPAQAAGAPIPIVAAENFYGDVARQIGGPDVTVHSILSNPDQDPHLFEVSPSVGRNVSAARIVIYSGIDYDPWMEKLLQAARSANRQTIVVADLVGGRPATIRISGTTRRTMLALADGARRGADRGRSRAQGRRTEQRLATVRGVDAAGRRRRSPRLRQRLAGTPVTATEPVFGYMFAALGMQVRNMPFQMAVMNNTEPGASDVAAFENDLRTAPGQAAGL